MEDIETKVRKIIAEKLSKNIDDVRLEADFIQDLGADSLDIVDMVMKLEEEFGISIPDEDLEKIKTVGDAIEYIKNKKK